MLPSTKGYCGKVAEVHVLYSINTGSMVHKTNKVQAKTYIATGTPNNNGSQEGHK